MSTEDSQIITLDGQEVGESSLEVGGAGRHCSAMSCRRDIMPGMSGNDALVFGYGKIVFKTWGLGTQYHHRMILVRGLERLLKGIHLSKMLSFSFNPCWCLKEQIHTWLLSLYHSQLETEDYPDAPED